MQGLAAASRASSKSSPDCRACSMVALGGRRADLLHALRAFLCIWCASCGALAPPFPRIGAGAHLSYLTATLQVASRRCHFAARSSKGTLHESNSESKERAASVNAARRPHNGGGNARQNYERYLALAREAQLAGDDVEMERCYQFAEHYFRVIRAANASDPEGKARSDARASGDRL